MITTFLLVAGFEKPGLLGQTLIFCATGIDMILPSKKVLEVPKALTNSAPHCATVAATVAKGIPDPCRQSRTPNSHPNFARSGKQKRLIPSVSS